MFLRTVTRATFALAFLGATACASAQSAYPSRPIRFIVPFPPGGGAEATARLVGVRLSESVKQPVVVEAHPGAGGAIGTEMVANAPADGYTLLLNTNASTILPHLQKVTWDPIKSLAPISLIETYPLVIAVHPSTPAQSLAELISYAKKFPGKLTYASSGIGGPTHLGAEMFKRAAGVDILHIPYKGNAPATLAILTGEVNVTFDSLVGPLPNIRAGKLRALALTGLKRSPLLPEVPTVIESGIPGYTYEAWNAVSAPAGTPLDVVKRLSAEFARIVNVPDVRRQLAALGYDPIGGPPEQLAQRVAEDYRRYGAVVKELQIRAE